MRGTAMIRTTTISALGFGMPSLSRPSFSLLALPAIPCSAASLPFHISGDPGGWPEVLTSIGLVNAPTGDVEVAPQGSAADWTARVERGTILIVEGESPIAAA